jgi:hypothetical protein
VCQGGDTVKVKGGSYSTQTITGSNSRSSDCVMAEANSETVTIASGNLVIGASAGRLSVDGFTLTGNVNSGQVTVAWDATPSNVTVLNMVANRFLIQSGTNITIRGGRYGNQAGTDNNSTENDNYANNKVEEFNGSNPTGIVVDGVVIHDMYCTTIADCHGEGLYLHNFTGTLTVKNSIFYNNDFFNIFVNTNNVQNVTLENNWFDIPLVPGISGGQRNPTYGRTTGIEWKFDMVSANWVIRNNSFHPSTGLSGGNSSTGTSVIVGNIFGLSNACAGMSAKTYNVYGSGTVCSGTGNTAGTIAYVAAPSSSTFDTNRESAIDFRLTGATWAADNLVAQASCAALDMFGTTRPASGSFCDAGAFER